MQDGDLETQSTEVVVTPTTESERPFAVELVKTTAATESVSGEMTESATVTAATSPQPSVRERLRSRIGSLWPRLREQRREAAAVVVLIVMAMVWSDSGSSGTGSASNSQDTLDSYDDVLSDFEPVGDVQAMRESADPFEPSSQNSDVSGLYIPSSEGSVSADIFSAKNSSADSGRSTPTTARYPDTTPAFNDSATQSSADYGQQQPRKVKFAGRIQPVN